MANKYGKSPGAWEAEVVSSGRLWEDHKLFVGEASLSKLSVSLRSFPDQGAAKSSTTLLSRSV